MSPRLVVTTGDPSGIGPEVAVRALAAWPGHRSALLVGERRSLEEAVRRYAPDANLRLLPIDGLERATVGEISAAGGTAAMAVLNAGIELVLAGDADAIVTGPVNKAAVREAGFGDFHGHTEYLALRGGVEGRVAMLLKSDRLSVIHVSTHRSLRSATELVPGRLDLVIDLAVEALQRAGARVPTTLVCGLNPHAGEHGLFGDEDEKVIAPAVVRARSRHPEARVTGPIAPDTCFVRALDVPETIVVAMYHDQGHIPVKLIAHDNAVNVTLGLPFVRTSVDHGTAHNIAGLGRANPQPMHAALSAAAQLVETNAGPLRS